MLDMMDSRHRNCDIASTCNILYAQPDKNPALHYNQLKTGYRIAFGLPITLLLAAFFAFFAVNDQSSTSSSTHEESKKNVELSVEAGGEMAAENNVEEPKDD